MSDNHGVPPSPTDIAESAIPETGDVLMRHRRWGEAASAFQLLPDRDAATEMKRRICANLASLQRHRLEVYELLISLPAQQHYSIAATASGKPTIIHRRPDGTAVSLSAGNDPLAAAAGAVQQIYGATRSGEAVGLCGIGDGYLAQVLAHNPPALFMDKRQPVFVIESDPHVLLQCLMIHDYTGAQGPIEQERFQWFVGSVWHERLEAALLADLYLAAPSLMVGQGFDVPVVQAALRSIVQKLGRLDAELTAEVDACYANFSARHPGQQLGSSVSRRPTVLLLTTRFSTVLQFSTRDTAAAFQRLGWEAHVVIEPSPHHRVLRTAIRAALADFRPDLVFQIDHLRCEHNSLFPNNLPFACWIQDHLPHLASREMGATIGPLDFVLTDATATYVDKFSYPLRQCIALPKLTVDTLPLPSEGEGRGEGGPRGASRRNVAILLPALPPHPNPLPQGERGPDAEDIVFVSNASQTPDAMIAQAVATYGQTPVSEELVRTCCGRIVATYDSGTSLPTYSAVCATLNVMLSDLHLRLPTEDYDRLARWLTHPFNDALYRQQALRWAAGAARDLGLTLALYGKGWESHPEFAGYARGPVAYGEPLAQLTRRSRINLQIVPYLCLHQRLLDGLMAGGFFLVRAHPADVGPAALLDFLDSNVGPSVRTTPAVEASLPMSLRERFDALLVQCRPCLCTTGQEDVVTMVRDWQEAGQLVAGEGPLPLFGETSFDDAYGLRERIERFIDAPLRRQEIASAQRHSVGARLTYDAGIRRVVQQIGRLMSEAQRTELGTVAA